jgi:hypothetical protein
MQECGVFGSTIMHVFDDISPPRSILDTRNEATLWCMVGAKGLSSLVLGRVTTGVSSRFVIPAFGQFVLAYFES